MHTISDEQLSAFIDKALSDSEMHHINNLLAESAELRERLHRLQQADEMARQFFASQDEIPLPAGLLDRRTGPRRKSSPCNPAPAGHGPLPPVSC